MAVFPVTLVYRLLLNLCCRRDPCVGVFSASGSLPHLECLRRTCGALPITFFVFECYGQACYGHMLMSTTVRSHDHDVITLIMPYGPARLYELLHESLL
jgi:hypothetical protein